MHAKIPYAFDAQATLQHANIAIMAITSTKQLTLACNVLTPASSTTSMKPALVISAITWPKLAATNNANNAVFLVNDASQLILIVPNAYTAISWPHQVLVRSV